MGRWDRNEIYRKRARFSGYRSRAAFKLLEIEDRFQILAQAQRVVDLCCAPGSWLQVIREICEKPECRIIGVDQVFVHPLDGVQILQRAIDAPNLVDEIRTCLGGFAGVVLSDCSPKLTGNKNLDRERQIWLAHVSLDIAMKLLEQKGHFVTKVFHSEKFQQFEIQLKSHFEFVKVFKPKSSFKRSPESYLVAKRFKGYQI